MEFLKLFSVWSEFIKGKKEWRIQQGGKSEGIRQTGKFKSVKEAVDQAQPTKHMTNFVIGDERNPPFKKK